MKNIITILIFALCNIYVSYSQSFYYSFNKEVCLKFQYNYDTYQYDTINSIKYDKNKKTYSYFILTNRGYYVFMNNMVIEIDTSYFNDNNFVHVSYNEKMILKCNQTSINMFEYPKLVLNRVDKNVTVSFDIRTDYISNKYAKELSKKQIKNIIKKNLKIKYRKDFILKSKNDSHVVFFNADTF